MMRLIAAVLRYIASVLEDSRETEPTHALQSMAALVALIPQPSSTQEPTATNAAAPPQATTSPAPQPATTSSASKPATPAPPTATSTTTPQSSSAAAAEPQPATGETRCAMGCRTVYVTEYNLQSATGKFHNERHCQGLRKATSKIVSMPLCSATLHGHTACMICIVGDTSPRGL